MLIQNHTFFQNPVIFRSHHITIIGQKGLVKSNFGIYYKYNQKSEVYNGLPKEGRYNDSHGCLQDKIKYDEIIYKLKFIILVRGDLRNKEMIEETCYPAASIRTLNYFLAHDYKH